MDAQAVNRVGLKLFADQPGHIFGRIVHRKIGGIMPAQVTQRRQVAAKDGQARQPGFEDRETKTFLFTG